MTRNGENKNAVDIARLEATLEAHVKDFREFKDDTLEYHKVQEASMKEMNKSLNDLAGEIRVFSGQMGAMSIIMQTQINDAINALEKIQWWTSLFKWLGSGLFLAVASLAYMIISNWWTKHF